MNTYHTYQEIVNFLHEKFNLPKEIFTIDISTISLQSEDYLCKESQSFKINYNQYFSSYSYKESLKEDWESIILYFPNNRIQQIIPVINQLNQSNNKRIIDKTFFKETNQNIDDFQFDVSYDDILITLVVVNRSTESFIDICRHKDKILKKMKI